MGAESNGRAAPVGDLDRIERQFARRRWPSRRVLAPAAAAARDRAGERLACVGPSELQRSRAGLLFAADVFGALAAEIPDHQAEAAEIGYALQEVEGLERLDLARESFRAPGLAALEPGDAVDAQLGLLLSLAPLSGAALWMRDASGQAHCARHLGRGSPSAPMRKLASALLAGEDARPTCRGELIGMPINGSQKILAALVARAEPRQARNAASFVRDAAAALAPIVERDMLLARNLADERAQLEASERKLTRLGFDLHDGPLQDIVVLGEDLRLFADQLARVVGDGREERLLRGRVGDLEAQLVALEQALRLISTSAHATVLTNRPFEATVRNLAERFQARAGIEPRVTLMGDLASISPSQRIALLSVVQEALNNVREHSDASHVEVGVSLEPEGVLACVVDDGCGFDVEKMLVSAAKRGRIGLAGIHERVRLLGGACQIDSCPGGPTVISITLPRWQPLVSAAAAANVAA
jgi:signal transduction histidine kinase